MNTVRFGILGAGGIANQFCDAVKRVEGAQVLAVASKSEQRARTFAQANGIGSAYGSYDQLLARADIDAVYIATTHNFHMELIRLALNAGKHVLCEKAMVLTRADAEEAFALAKEKGLFLMEAMWTRFLPQYQKAKQWILDGRIGNIQSAACSIAFRAHQNPEGRLLNPALAGGAMYDIGVYAIEPIAYLVGQPVVDALGVWRPHPVTGVDERVTVILRFPDCDAALQVMFSANAREYVYITGDRGFIEFPFVSGGHTVRLFDENRALAEEFTDCWENGFVYELREMIRCLAQGKLHSDIMPPEATIECAGVFEKILSTTP